MNRVVFTFSATVGSRNGGVDPKSKEDEMMSIKKAAKDTGSLGTYGTDPKFKGNTTVGRTRSADRESAKDAGDITSRVMESSSGSSGDKAVDISGLSAVNRTSRTVELARNSSKDEKDFKIKEVVGEATISLLQEGVGVALGLGVSLEVNDEIRVYFIGDTGIVERVTPNQYIEMFYHYVMSIYPYL